MNRDDEDELGEIVRSIEGLFGREDEIESNVTEPSVVETGAQPAVGAASEVGGEPDADTQPELTPEPGLLPEAEETPVEAEETPVEPEETPVEPEPTPSDIGQALAEATSHYLRVPIDERQGAEREVREAVEKARAAGALDEIASNVDVLLLGADGDAYVEALADDLMDEDVLARMAVALGSVRDEEKREALIQAYSRVGGPAAKAIADALTETEDRLARKTYVAALGALGSAAADAVERMLQDSRWFVVRNGVAVLGTVGGPHAIEVLTASLAHEKSGVRRETVLSLAKIGGEDAGLLVSSMLGDSDPGVRGAAARAVSALKVERAYKPLMEILKQGDEEPVIEQVLRALGALGDPSAVPAIEKRVSGSLFSRPPTGVRIAGLFALAAIGTPHALSLVEGAKADKDPEISSAAEQILAGR